MNKKKDYLKDSQEDSEFSNNSISEKKNEESSSNQQFILKYPLISNNAFLSKIQSSKFRSSNEIEKDQIQNKTCLFDEINKKQKNDILNKKNRNNASLIIKSASNKIL